MDHRSVLIVDDHAEFRAMARHLLADHGFNVVGEAEDGASALVEAARLRPSVVVLDIRLPDFDGFEVTRRLLAGEPRSGPVPAVVLISTQEAIDLGSPLRESRALGFITKSRLSGATLTAILKGPAKERW
jgi:two-component system nitrate/nitrite response regulator NarL